MTVDVIGNDKITTSHFLLKDIANRTLQNYAVANGLTPASAQNTSLLHFLYKIINTMIVCLITCPKIIFKWNKTLIIPKKLIFEICIMYNPCKSHLLWIGGTEGSVTPEYDSVDKQDHGVESRKTSGLHSGWGLDGVMKKGQMNVNIWAEWWTCLVDIQWNKCT